MNYFTCDACHYIFHADDMPSSCPACSASSIIAQNNNSKKFKIPAVRFSTETEMEQSRLAETGESATKSFLERVKNLTGYTLTNDEYHTALMLLFYFKSAPKEITSMHLNDLLCGRNSFIENKMAETAAGNLYLQAQKHFTSELGRERAGDRLQRCRKSQPIRKKVLPQACYSCSVRMKLTRFSEKPLTLQTSAA